MESFILVALLAVIGLFIYFPRTLMVLAVTFALAIACTKQADAARRLEVTAVVESVSDGPAMDEAMTYAARVYSEQLGIELVMKRMAVSRISTDTDAGKLLAQLKAFPHDGTVVLFTRRDIRVGTTDYAGMATVGTAPAAAIVELRGDGLDGQILAHELAHTLGVPHDTAAGYLMSENLGRGGAGVFSPESVRALTTPSKAPQAAVKVTHGGGVMGASEAVAWLLFAALAIVLRAVDIRRQRAEHRARDLEDTMKLLEPPAVADIMSVTAHSDNRGARWLGIQFATLSGLNAFRGWIEEEHRRAIVRIREQIDKSVK